MAAEQLADTSCACQTCGKHFSTANAYNNHLKSKKHRETAARQMTTDVQQTSEKLDGKTKDGTHSSNELQCDSQVTTSSGDIEARGGVSEKDFGTFS